MQIDRRAVLTLVALELPGRLLQVQRLAEEVRASIEHTDLAARNAAIICHYYDVLNSCGSGRKFERLATGRGLDLPWLRHRTRGDTGVLSAKNLLASFDLICNRSL